MNRGLRLRTRLILANLSLLALMILAVAGWWFQTEERRILEEIRDHLTRSVLLMQGMTEDMLAAKGWSGDTVQGMAYRLEKIAGLRVTIVDVKGEVWGDSRYEPSLMENHAERPEIREALRAKQSTESVRFSDTLKTSMWYKAEPLRIQERVVGAIRVAKPETEIEEALKRLRWTFFISLGGIIAAAFGVGVMIMHRVTQPLLELERLARRYAVRSPRDVNGSGRDELGQLGATLQSMAQSLSEAVEAMREEKQKLQVILENMKDGLLVFNDRMELEMMNRSAETILGLDRTHVMGRTVPELLVHPDLEEWMLEANQQNTPVSGEFETRIPVARRIHALAAPIDEKRDEGSILGTIVLLRDLTRVRRLERVRQDFVANVSHELRTPVTAVKVMAETLAEDEDLPTDKRRFIHGILQESDRMARIVEDLLLLAQLDEGKAFCDRFIPFDLRKLVEEIADHMGSGFYHCFVMDIPPDLPLIQAQADRIRHVIVNLLENAQKYTPETGQIKISAERQKDQLVVAVSDTGQGIPLGEQDRIFERFYRVDKARSRAMGGTGLGLSIVKRIVEGYHGKVWVQSEEGKGATFYFTLPITPL